MIIESPMYGEINTSELNDYVGEGHSYQGMNSLQRLNLPLNRSHCRKRGYFCSGNYMI